MSRLRNGMPAGQLQGTTWRKSSRSGPTGGNCVEMAPLPDSTLNGALNGAHDGWLRAAPGGAIAVRDSRQPDGPALIFTVTAWQAFTGGLDARACRPDGSTALTA